MTDQDTRGGQVESAPQCPRGTTRTWCPLLGYLCPGSDMANGEVLSDPVHPSRGWQSRQLDFVMAYPQVPAEMPLYMRLPQGYKCNGMTRKTHALKLICNVYGQKQAGQVWNKYMDLGMREIGFTPRKIRPLSIFSWVCGLPSLY